MKDMLVSSECSARVKLDLQEGSEKHNNRLANCFLLSTYTTTMNKLTLLVSLLCVALAAAGKAPQGWPSTFAVTYNETVLFGYNPGSVMKTFYYDGVNQRGHLSSGVAGPKPSDFFLIYKAQDAPADYISLRKNPEGTMAPNNCYFRTQPFNNVTAPSSYSFGDLWNNAENNNGVLSFLFKYPQLVYYGDVYIAELGVWSAQWNSVEVCNLIQSGIGLVPCTSVFISKDGRDTTLKEIHANAVNPNSYYRDTYLMRIYHSNSETLPSGAFDLPNDWVDSCGYADSGFIFNTAIDVFKDRTGLLALSLAVPPVGKSTRVKVSFAVNPEDNFKCTDCVKLRSPSLYFDATNWNVPQALYIDYNNYGCEKLDIVASGGGYDWQIYPRANAIRLLSCVANNDYKTCYSLQKQCMMIM